MKPIVWLAVRVRNVTDAYNSRWAPGAFGGNSNLLDRLFPNAFAKALPQTVNPGVAISNISRVLFSPQHDWRGWY